MISLFLKGVYQSLQIHIPLFFYRLVAGKKKNQIKLAKDRLIAKRFNWNKTGKTKVFAIFSISNWESVFLDPLSEFGEVHHFSWPGPKDFFTNKEEWLDYYNKINADLVIAFDQFRVDAENILVFVYASDFSISKATMQYLNRSNVLIISFCWDDLLYFKGNVKGQPVGISKLSTYADINLTMSPESIPRYNYDKSPCFFWSSVKVTDKTIAKLQQVCVNEKFYVLFIGSKYGWRAYFIEKLIKAGFTVKCYGNGWADGILSAEEMKTAIQNAPVTLGFANIGYTKNCTTIKGRDFEVPLYGGLYLTQYSEGLVRYYEPGYEVLTYRNVSECIAQLKIIEADKERGERIRAAGYQKAACWGSWESRFLYLSQLIGQIVE